MNSSFDRDDRFAEVESLLQAAGQYVRASDDLRPRVLETARSEAGERRAQRHVRRLAILATIVAAVLSTGSSTGGGHTGLDDAEAVYRQASLRATNAGDFSWGLVQAYADLRERQSERLRLQRPIGN